MFINVLFTIQTKFMVMETRFSNKYNTLPPDYLLSEQGVSTFSYQPYPLWWSATKIVVWLLWASCSGGHFWKTEPTTWTSVGYYILYPFIILWQYIFNHYLFSFVINGSYSIFNFDLSFHSFSSDIPHGQCAWIGASTWNY